jgi:hypothetical protein
VKATSSSWKLIPFNDGVPLEYHAVFNSDEFSKLEAGVIPKAMEDKWFIYYEEPFLFFHRSWTGAPVYRLTIEKTPDGARIMESLLATQWIKRKETDLGYEAKLIEFLVSNLLLGQDIPFPLPEYARGYEPGAYQHNIAGTGYREMPVKP